jgi:hypothetical protein
MNLGGHRAEFCHQNAKLTPHEVNGSLDLKMER